MTAAELEMSVISAGHEEGRRRREVGSMETEKGDVEEATGWGNLEDGNRVWRSGGWKQFREHED